MTTQALHHILCAVRGGPESRTTAAHAISLALEHDARLTFFHVLDAEFLDHALVVPLSVIYQELHEMGKFSMMILCERAERAGVEKVDTIVREGSIREQLRRIAIETQADLMIMGRPVRSPGSNVFKPAEFDAFIANLEAVGGDLQVVQVTPSTET
ncbi:MAG: universal stress protein [Chloroflexota bacterium]|nr:universal stress protein [Chloroflexota bacterium]